MTPDPCQRARAVPDDIPDVLRKPDDPVIPSVVDAAIRDLEEARKRLREGPRRCQVCGAIYCGPDHGTYPGRLPAALPGEELWLALDTLVAAAKPRFETFSCCRRVGCL